MLGCHSSMSTGWLIISVQPLESQAQPQRLPLPARKRSTLTLMVGRPYIFEPIAMDTLGILNTSARQLLYDLDRKISEHTGEVRETSFLFQRCSVLVQRFNAILLHDSLPAFDCAGWLFISIFVSSVIFKIRPRSYLPRVKNNNCNDLMTIIIPILVLINHPFIRLFESGARHIEKKNRAWSETNRKEKNRAKQ